MADTELDSLIRSALDISERTIKRDWEKARILLQHELSAT
jgi:hypothetical protein